MNEPIFEFTMKAAVSDLSGYYHTRWDRAEEIIIFATTREQAYNIAGQVLGECRQGYYWSFRVKNIRHVFPEVMKEDNHDS